MSLINDALKRARQAQEGQSNPETQARHVPLEPVGRPRRASSLPVWILPALILVCLAGGSVLLWLGWRAKHPTSTPSAGVTAPMTAAVVTTVKPVPPVVAPAVVAKPKVHVSTNLVTRPVPMVPPPAEPAPEQAKSIATAAVPPPAPEPAPTPAPVSAAPLVSVPAVPVPVPPPVEPVVPVVFPALRLQGIFYRLSRPSVSINGKTCYVGDFVEGVKVARIQRESVVVELGGQTKTLYVH